MHLGAEKNSDVSADLTQLSRNKMFVISSGAKSILDLSKLEVNKLRKFNATNSSQLKRQPDGPPFCSMASLRDIKPTAYPCCANDENVL